MKHLLILFLIIFWLKGSCQTTNNLQEFNFVTSKLLAQTGLKIHKCNFSVLTAKIEVDTSGNYNVKISDNADSTLFAELTNSFKKLDVRTLVKFLKEENLTKETFLLPLSFMTITAKCLNPIIDQKVIFDAYKFDGKPFFGYCIWLEIIGFKVIISEN